MPQIQDRALTDKELLSVFNDDRADLSLLSREERNRLVGLTEPSEQAPPQASATSRFLEGAIRANPLTNSWDFLSQLVTDPKAAAAGVVDPSVDQLRQMQQAHTEGRPVAAVGHALGAIPMVGPYVAGAVERAQGGDVAGAAGELSWLALPGAKKAAGLTTDAVAAGAKTVAPELANRGANWLDKTANEKVARVISPQVGSNKIRLGNKAVEAAPGLLRDPELNAYSRSGLADKIATRLDEATEGLDTAADARLVSQQVKTGPLVAQLDKAISELTAQPVEASKAPRARLEPRAPTRSEQLAGITGELTEPQAYRSEPYGQAVEPQPNSAQIATLKQIRQEIASLGPVADYEAVRRIRQAWDSVAKVKYLPATAQDALKAQGDATGALKGTASMREALAGADPNSAAAYRRYSLYKTAHDVVQAAEEAERVRPNRGRGIVAHGVGAMIGAKEGGVVGAGIGALVAGIVDKAAEMSPTLQIRYARLLAHVADTLRSGDVAKAHVLTNEIVQSFPAVRTGLKIVGRTSAMAGRAQLPAKFAAEQNERDQ